MRAHGHPFAGAACTLAYRRVRRIEAPMAPTPPARTPAHLVQRVLARFELACPSLRDYQVNVQILGRDAHILVLPAAAKARGCVELVVTAKGRLRTCVFPDNMQARQVAAVEDLAWAVYEALADTAAHARPAPAPGGF